MLPNKLDVQSIWDRVDAITKIQKFTIAMDESDYLENELVQSAIERKLEFLGEAARPVSNDFQAQHLKIDWRNIIAHRYDQIEQERVWNIVQTVLPKSFEASQTQSSFGAPS